MTEIPQIYHFHAHSSIHVFGNNSLAIKQKKFTLPTLDKKEELLKEKLVNLDEVFVTRIVGVKCHKWTYLKSDNNAVKFSCQLQ